MNSKSKFAVMLRMAGRSLAALAVLVSLLLSFNIGTVQASKKPPAPAPVWSAFPSADGTVTDVNFDGKGDWFSGDVGSMVVGFNALGQFSNFGPGEHRGVYEFNIRSAQKVKHNGHVLLYLNSVGTRVVQEGTDPHLTLYAGKGDGVVNLADFKAGKLVSAFDLYNPVMYAPDPYDVVIDVTPVVRDLIRHKAAYVVFVIRPNPAAKNTVGADLFSSNYTAQFSDQFVPPKLVIEK